MSTIQTFTGLEVNPLDLKPEDISIWDIAHALSMKCRFSGHCRDFYSVAEHSVYVARETYKITQNTKLPAFTSKKDILLGALLHDAAEAYLADIPRPVKKEIAGFDKIEEKALRTIFQQFGISKSYKKIMEFVKNPDESLLVTEAAVLLRNPVLFEEKGLTPASVEIKCLGQREAEHNFLKEFKYLMEL